MSGRSLFQGFPETFPRLLGNNKELILPEDVVETVGDLKLICARPEHAPIMKESIRDMLLNEVTTIAAGVTDIPEESLKKTTYNLLRYPITYFTINSQDEIVAINCFNVVYKDESKDPIPLLDDSCGERSHSYQAIVDFIATFEERILQEHDKVVICDMIYVPTSLRGQGISKTLFPIVLKMVITWAISQGFRWHYIMTTSWPSLANVRKYPYEEVETFSKKFYKKTDGSEMVIPQGEMQAKVFRMDMIKVKENGFFGK